MNAKLHDSKVIVVDKSAVRRKHLVYLLVSERAAKYAYGRPHVVYIGETAKGVSRIAKSVAFRAKQIFGMYGNRRLEVRVVSCPRRPGLSMWKILERDLLKCFKGLYGELPKCNTQGKKLNPNNLSGYFNAKKLNSILTNFKY